MDVKRILHGILAGILILAFIVPDVRVYAQGVIPLPQAGAGSALSPAFSPVLLKGIKVRVNDPFRFDFILDKGNGTATAAQIKSDATRLIKYFLASLTIPESDLWVNLSPYEKDRIIPDAFGQTGMGRDLLGLDYLLKKTMAMLLHPDGAVGKKFWEKLYARAYEVYGTTDIPIDTFNKVWITTDSAEIYARSKDEGTPVQAAVAFVTATHLKVMLESDYVAMSRQRDMAEPLATAAPGDRQFLAKEIIRDVVIPVLEKEVNEGRDFSQLRQIYTSLVLATWYKKELTNALVTMVYADQGKVAGITHHDPGMQQKIWDSYAETFRKGVYNLIREEVDPASGETLPRKYFSGGVVLHGRYKKTEKMPSAGSADDYAMVNVDLAQEDNKAAATLSEIIGSSDELASKFKLFGKGKLSEKVKVLLSSIDALIQENKTKEFVQVMLDIMEAVTPDAGNRIVNFLQEEIGKKFPTKDLVDEDPLLKLFANDPGEQEMLREAVNSDPEYIINTALKDLLKKEVLPPEDVKAAKRTALLLQCLYKFPQARVPLRHLVDLESSGILDLLDHAIKGPVFKGDRSVSEQERSIRSAILNDNGPLLVRLISEIPCSEAKRSKVLLLIQRTLPRYGYSLVDIDRIADSVPPVSDRIDKDTVIHLQLATIDLLLNDTAITKELILEKVQKVFENVRKILPDNPKIYQELIAKVRAEAGLGSVQIGYLNQLAEKHKGNENALFAAVTQARTAALLGFDEKDIAVLKAFQFLKKHKTHPTLQRIRQYIEDTESDIDPRTIDKPLALQGFFKAIINLSLFNEQDIYLKEYQALEDFDRKSPARGYAALVMAMMEETGADRETVQEYLTSKKVSPSDQEELLKANVYPVYFLKSAYVNKKHLVIMTQDVKDAVEKILNGIADGNQNIPNIYRTTLGSQNKLAVYIRIDGMIGKRDFKQAGLSDDEITALVDTLSNNENNLISALYAQSIYTLQSGDIKKFTAIIKRIVSSSYSQDKLIDLFKTAQKNRKVVIVAFGAVADFKMSSSSSSMSPDFEAHLKALPKKGSIDAIPVYADQAMSLEKDLGGIDLDPAAMKLSVHTDAAHAGAPGVPFTITPEQLAALRRDLQGLKPVIVNMTQHAQLGSFLEL